MAEADADAIGSLGRVVDTWRRRCVKKAKAVTVHPERMNALTNFHGNPSNGGRDTRCTLKTTDVSLMAAPDEKSEITKGSSIPPLGENSRQSIQTLDEIRPTEQHCHPYSLSAAMLKTASCPHRTKNTYGHIWWPLYTNTQLRIILMSRVFLWHDIACIILHSFLLAVL